MNSIYRERRQEAREAHQRWDQEQRTEQRCTVILDRLKAHFPAAPVAVRRARIFPSQWACHVMTDDDTGAYVIAMHSDPAYYKSHLTLLMAMYHEFAHVLVGSAYRDGNAHGPEFFAALLRVLKADGKRPRWYHWHHEYGIVYEAALLAGLIATL